MSETSGYSSDFPNEEVEELQRDIQYAGADRLTQEEVDDLIENASSDMGPIQETETEVEQEQAADEVTEDDTTDCESAEPVTEDLKPKPTHRPGFVRELRVQDRPHNRTCAGCLRRQTLGFIGKTDELCKECTE